jgi:glutathione S-transferase
MAQIVAEKSHISKVEREGLARREAGPYWLGPRFSIVDATIYPWFEQKLDGGFLRGALSGIPVLNAPRSC